MTRYEAHSLSNSKLYRFQLYHGREKIGFLSEDIQLNQFFIVTPNSQNRDKPHREIGLPVKLEQIISWPEYIHNPITNAESYTLPNNRKAKKMVILGAGASFDFTHASPSESNLQMPLTKDIFHDSFEKIIEKYPGASDLSSEISLLISKGGDLENYFEKQWKKIVDNYDPILLNKLINTQYYIHDLFNTLSEELGKTRKTNYYNLIKLAHDYIISQPNEYIPLITFNYDTLLEQAIERHYNTKFVNIDDYINTDRKNLLIFKPHGSSNWVKKFKAGLYASNFIGLNVNSIDVLAKQLYDEERTLPNINDFLQESITFDIKNPNKSVKNNAYYNYYFPWLLIPYKNKDDFMMPSKHEAMLEHVLGDVEEILIIGWKGSEQKFQQMLKRKLEGKEIKITLIEPDKEARLSFMREYKTLLPKVIFEDTNSNFTTFSNYMSYTLEAEKHFFN